MATKTKEYKAYLRIRELGTNEIVDSIGLSSTHHRHVERVMMGLLINMDTDRYFIDDSEVPDED